MVKNEEKNGDAKILYFRPEYTGNLTSSFQSKVYTNLRVKG